jgi:deoxyhypusine monooxygenase
VAEIPASELEALKASLLNVSGKVALHSRFRALFTLKALKNGEAIRIISEGLPGFRADIVWMLIFWPGFRDPSALLKHELAYCLGQMKDASALPILEAVLRDESEDPMVRHEVSR